MSKGVTIGFVPRERFSLAPESLKTILDCTPEPFNLIVVNCNMPRVHWSPMEEMLQGRDNVTAIYRDHYLLPNQCRNLVLQEATGEYLCLIENDDLVSPGWLSRFLRSIERHGTDVVVPLIMEGPPGDAHVHFDEGLGTVRELQTSEGIKWEIVGRPGSKEQDVGAGSRSETFMETHCLFFRRSVFDRIGPFDEELSTSEEIDLSLALYKAGASAVFDPECVIHYIQPPSPVDADDRGYFLTKWDLDRARRSHERIRERWNLVRMPQLLGFVEERNLKGTGNLGLWRDELASLISAEESLILVDELQWQGSEAVRDLRHVPFIEREGQYWGAPADDDTAITELARLEQSGARAIAFAWPAFWWFDYYSGFNHHLRSTCRVLIENEHVVAFDLRRLPS